MTQEYIRKVCIIAKCTKFIPAKFLACNALFACKSAKQPKWKQAEYPYMRILTWLGGSVFTRKQDQDNVIYFLRDTEKNYGYATRRHVDAILNAWSVNPWYWWHKHRTVWSLLRKLSACGVAELPDRPQLESWRSRSVSMHSPSFSHTKHNW